MTNRDKFIESTLQTAIEAHQQGQLELAEKGYRKILASSPDHADALHLTGLLAFQRGALMEAKNLIKKAIGQNNQMALYYANLGRVEMAMENPSAAIDAWNSALTLSDDRADIHSDIAGAMFKNGHYDEAMQQADQALTDDPTHALALLNKGLSLAALDQVDAAIIELEKASSAQPENIDIWTQLGHLHQTQNNGQRAESCYTKAVQVNPHHVESLNDLGNLYCDQLRFDEAIQIYRKALTVDSKQSDIHSNLGVAQQERGDSKKAIVAYRQAIRIDPENAEAHRNLGMALLQEGDFAEGWAEYEWRWQTAHFKPLVRPWAQPRWQGQDAGGKTLLIRCEQGFGDCLQFARYFAMAAQKVSRLIVAAPQELAALFARIDGVDEVLVAGNPQSGFDLQIPLMSLPHVFRTTLTTVPNTVPYLSPDPDKSARWQSRLNKKPGQKLVGLAWRGSGAHHRNAIRSPGLDAFGRLFEADPGLRLISLQKDVGPEDRNRLAGNRRIEEYTSELTSFDETAALISLLDQVVAPDTAVAHLAGGLGVPTILVLPVVSEWRWLRRRSDSPWYPNTQLARQQTQGDWVSCMDFIMQHLVGR